MNLQGSQLVDLLCEHSQLEKSNFNYHFSEILETQQINPDSLTMEQLREILSNYIQDLILELNDV